MYKQTVPLTSLSLTQTTQQQHHEYKKIDYIVSQPSTTPSTQFAALWNFPSPTDLEEDPDSYSWILKGTMHLHRNIKLVHPSSEPVEAHLSLLL